MSSDVSDFPRGGSDESDKYALSGKIMLSAIVILFTVVILIICLHIYARWFLARSHRRQQQLRNNRRRGNRAHIIFTTNITTPSSTLISHGLEPSLLKSLPTFIFTSKKSSDDTQKQEEDEQTLECAVCLSEFEENEMGRLLPKCNHSFHIGCIDMWFHSHSTCPLCRSPVEPIHHDSNNNKVEIIIDSAQQQQQPNLETSSTGVLCSSCEMGSSSSSFCSTSSSNSNDNTSFGSRRKVGVSIEVPRRTENLKTLEEEIQGSPRFQAFKSPGGRILSFRRMLSREKRPSTPTSSCSFHDLERGENEEQLQQIVHQSSNHLHQQGERSSRTESVA